MKKKQTHKKEHRRTTSRSKGSPVNKEKQGKSVFYSHNPQETAGIAAKFVENLLKTRENCGKQVATLVVLQGNLGAGKTTFVQAAAQALGITKTITSPTFVLEKVYKIPNPTVFSHLIHIDAYRLGGGDELLSLGWWTIVQDPKNLIFLEWPERVSGILPEEKQTIQFKPKDETIRVLTFF